MFGHYTASVKTDKKKKNTSQVPQQSPEDKEKADKQKRESDIAQRVASDKQKRNTSEQEGKEKGKSLYNEEVPGLGDEKRSALKYEASRNIDRSLQKADRKLLGEQSRRGIVGKGGVGYAQRRDLHNMALEAQGGAQRDLTNLDEETRMKQLAQIFAAGQGEASQAMLDEQKAIDQLEHEEERKRQREFEDQVNRRWNRV